MPDITFEVRMASFSKYSRIAQRASGLSPTISAIISLAPDKAVSAFLSQELSRSRLEESFKAGDVKMNGEPIVKKHELRPGDTVEIAMPPPHTTISEF